MRRPEKLKKFKQMALTSHLFGVWRSLSMAKENTRQARFVPLILSSVIRAQHQTPQNKRFTKTTNQTKLHIAKRSVLLTTKQPNRTLKIKNKHFKGSYLAASKTVYRFSVNKASNLFRKLHLTTHTFRNYQPAKAGIIPYQHIDQGALHRLSHQLHSSGSQPSKNKNVRNKKLAAN